jgi:hypothetical protein
MVDTDDEDRRDTAASNEVPGCFCSPPGDAGKRPRRLEQILTVVQIQNGVSLPVNASPEAGREPDGDAPLRAEVQAGEVVRDQHREEGTITPNLKLQTPKEMFFGV